MHSREERYEGEQPTNLGKEFHPLVAEEDHVVRVGGGWVRYLVGGLGSAWIGDRVFQELQVADVPPEIGVVGGVLHHEHHMTDGKQEESKPDALHLQRDALKEFLLLLLLSSAFNENGGGPH